MSPTYAIKNPRRTETITVERKSESGVMANDKWYNPSKFKPELLESMEIGGTYELTISTTTAKTGKTYDNVIGVKQIGEGQYGKPQSSLGMYPSGGAAQMSGQVFVDKDAVRQRLIVRQSSLAQAVAYSQQGTDTEGLLELAERFCNWVFEVDPRVKQQLEANINDVEFPD